MIISTIIILYFIQIRHTDDFPSTGTRLVTLMGSVHGEFGPVKSVHYNGEFDPHLCCG